ncbi:hypothetical protein [Enterovirga rhinocerotis]|uniref:hypothetical protein n=1 Tax=Enterovirga rhinocerotis TaxID=1339210 RepID=UPI00105B51F9|nr:hypothetical protein [Enterovirga rhinocerotis]
MRKVLVVDSGHRTETDLLSTELAELGLASITTSVEAAEAVLDMMDLPSAVFMNMPGRPEGLEPLRRLAATLRGSDRTAGVPIIEWTREAALSVGGVSALLKAAIGPQALHAPET